MADCIGTGFPQFSCPLVQMRYSIGENGCSHIFVTLAVKKEVTGDKEGKAEERGKRSGICIRQVAIQVENTNIYISRHFITHYYVKNGALL